MSTDSIDRMARDSAAAPDLKVITADLHVLFTPLPHIRPVMGPMYQRSKYMASFTIEYFDFYNKYTGWAKKVDHFQKCITPVYDDIGSCLLYTSPSPRDS